MNELLGALFINNDRSVVHNLKIPGINFFTRGYIVPLLTEHCLILHDRVSDTNITSYELPEPVEKVVALVQKMSSGTAFLFLHSCHTYKSYVISNMLWNIGRNNVLDLVKLQDYGKINAVHESLEETKVILVNVIESVLQRGEKLDELIARSETLTSSSKSFYINAKKMNKCSCNIS